MKSYRFLNYFLVILLASCSFKEVTVSGIKDYKVKKMSAEGIEIEVGVGLNNPNNYGFSICKSSFDASFGNKKLGSAKTQKRVHVKAKSDEVYYFPIKVNLDDFSLSDLPSLMSSFGKGSKISLKGNLVVGKFLFRKKIPIDQSQAIPGLKK